ncbi:YLP motif-containing protein 1-like isoform X1 [Ostrinia furnacalis]|uniref:YLP motif-containing protein 1-like isoform X1 n=1 Tax=Ostrinia furnacalis TaxID=93504 RepID=UPI00103FC6D0|nr:YLP motif-containing protein 1-like isoform X1 [Ostrinia furnacalis]
MSWPVPQPGQLPPGAGMTPDMMNVGSYTPDQWAAMQQNWQQWAQWQQQYAQWQSQYGAKYVAQMQGTGSGPVPPSSAPLPAPPPPDHPPPPPSENNQPLYASAPANPQPTPVPPPASRTSNPSNLTSVNITSGNAQNQWSHGYRNDAPPPTPQNSDALQKLAEEEKLFDIQFQKWEEEIEKWRLENVNHPDKQAYKEYEQKFETCRAQLLERRQHMKQKRARLTGAGPAAADAPYAGKNSFAVPPPLNDTPTGYAQNPSQSYNQNQSQSYNQNKNQNYNQKPSNNQNPPQKYNQNQPPNYNQNKSQYNNPNQSYNNRQEYQNQQNYNKQDQNYSDPNASSYKHFNNPPPGIYNRGNRDNIDPQDRYESYEDHNSLNETYPPKQSSFLPTSGASKSIPGLDLVPDSEKGPPMQQQEVIDITEEKADRNQPRRGPDYTTISKGINNILGDEKIMNILSMVVGGNAPSGNSPQSNTSAHSNNAPNAQSGPPMGHNNQNIPPNNQWNRNEGYNNNQQFGNRQNYPMQQNQDQNRYPPNQRQNQMYDDRQGAGGQDMYYNRNSQFRGPNMPPQRNDQGPRPNAPGPRPLMAINLPPNMDIHCDVNRGPPPNWGMQPNMPPPNQPPSPPRPKWKEEPLFTPSFVVEYEHKPLRLKAREFIEPVHMFDYDHKSKEGEKKRDFEKEVDELFSRKPRRNRDEDQRAPDRYEMHERPRERDGYNRDFERRVPRDDIRDDYRHRPPRDEIEDKRRLDDRYDDRRRDDRDRDIRDKFGRREDVFRDRERERERERDRDKDRDRNMFYSRDRYHRREEPNRREEPRIRSRSRERDVRKRGHSRESDTNDLSKRSREHNSSERNSGSANPVVMIDDLLEAPGREMRPEKIVIILRGPPGSGKSYLAKLIRDREAEYGGAARIMSIDDYFMQEGEVEEKDPVTGKIVKKPTLKYEYDESLEESYLNSLKRAFKRSLTDGYFNFLIFDAVNDHLRSYADVWNYARQNGFQVYVCTMELDPHVCHRRNIHNRSLGDIQVVCSRFFPTPPHHIQLDATTLLQSASIREVHMEDADDAVVMDDAQQEVESSFTSKWEKMDDATQLERLDGTSKPLRPSQISMEDYLQLDEWTPNKAKPGKKSVRWADIEERRQQEKMRAIGFVVGQTDWNRMTDPTMGSSALTQTKYIERVRKN